MHPSFSCKAATASLRSKMGLKQDGKNLRDQSQVNNKQADSIILDTKSVTG